LDHFRLRYLADLMVEFVIRLPDGSPEWEPAYLTGSIPALGNWKANAIQLDRWGDGTYRKKLDIPWYQTSQFLVTRGNWRWAEVDQNSREILPHSVHPTNHLTVESRVYGWGRSPVRYHHDFESKNLVRKRSLIVYLPSGYDLFPDRRYPVMYMQDGQNIFDANTSFGGIPWGCGDIAERLARAGQAWPIIIVAVANTPDRVREYGPREKAPKKGKNADMSRRYGRYLVEEVKPFIDKNYRTMPGPHETAICGSSMGGLISLHLSQWYPDVFGLCAAMSPSLWWDHEYFLRNISSSPGWMDMVKLWLDVGGREGQTRNVQIGTARRVRRLAKIFEMRGRIEGVDYSYLEVPDGLHNESAWAGRFDRVLKFLFGAG
jgi:predicted alpha/beta superfamily hydrolase